MKSLVAAFIMFLALSPMVSAVGPMPGPVTTDFGCSCVKLAWGPADSADIHPDGYIVYKSVETPYN